MHSLGTVTRAECCSWLCTAVVLIHPPWLPVAQISSQLLKSQCQYRGSRAAKYETKNRKEISLVNESHVCAIILPDANQRVPLYIRITATSLGRKKFLSE